MAWSIAEVARASGVTSRTLRHYHAIGLLEPAWTADGGRRYYEQEQLLRLQQILLLRTLGVGLDAVADVVARDGATSTVQVLHRHRDALLAEQERLARLVGTVEATIAALEGGEQMSPQRVFEGFERNPYEEEARERYGDAVVDESAARMQGWSDADAEKARTGYARVHEGLAALRAGGAEPADERVQELVQLHYEVTCLFWTPDAQSYAGLGQTYVNDERFRASIGGDDPTLAEYLRDAMAVYAQRRLTR